MTTHNYNIILASSPARYHRATRGGNKVLRDALEQKATRGGNKVLRDALEQNRYDNKYLLSKEYIKHNNNKLNRKIMATKNLLESSLGSAVMASVRKGMFTTFCESLASSLASSASASCGIGHITYAALVAIWRKDTANCGYTLNESEGRKLYAADPADSRLRRIGEEGHWSWFVAPAAAEDKEESERRETDSITVLVGTWFKSWSSWYDSVVRFGHYGKDGVPACSCISSELLNRCHALWSFRGVGGRVAATSEEKKQKKVAKAVEGLSAAELLAALKASGVDLAALVGGGAASTDNNTNE